MDRFHAMQVFNRIVELGGFGKAADSLGLPRASVTTLIKQLEAHLGVQLLQRTTRQVSPTPDGEAFYERSVRLLAELEEAESSVSEARHSPTGLLRVELPGSLARLVVIPALPDFCARYPRLELEIGTSDRPVDLVREGVDCVLRAGEFHDARLAARPLPPLPQVSCASPAYLARVGTPASIDALEGHRAVNYFSALSGRRFEFEFQCGGATLALFPRPGGTKAEHTAVSFRVHDIAAEIADLESRGVVFEDYDLPGLKTVGHVCVLGSEKAAWFKDTEGNYLCIHEDLA